MAKMVTIEQRAVGVFNWGEDEQARIERNVFAQDGEIREALRFCKNRNGRHNRVHLVIEERDFVDLFRSAVQNGVFQEETLRKLRGIVDQRRDPLLEVIGSCTGSDGKLAENIDDELYGENPA
ncbi:MAG: hypothetical protein WCA00_04815 [Candidatus Acidiferrales bacterium]